MIAVFAFSILTIPSVYALPNLHSVLISPQYPDPVVQGESTTYYIVVSRGEVTEAFSANLSITGELPEGASGSFEPSQVSFAQNDIMPQFSILTISTLDMTPTGNSTFSVKAAYSDTDMVIGTGALSIFDNSDTELPNESTGQNRSQSSYYEEPESTEESTETSSADEVFTGFGNLRAIPASQNIITLDWSSTFENRGLLVTSYKIERRSVDETNFVEIANLSPQFLKYSDEGLVGNTQYVYRISEMIYDDALSTSNLVNATTLSFVNKVSKLDQNAPSAKNIKFLSEQDETLTDGFGGKLATYSGPIPTQIMHTGVEQQLEISVSDNAGISAINSVAVNMHFDNLVKKGDTFFLYNEDTGDLTVSDPDEIFGNVNVYRTYTKSEMVLNFFFTPNKPTPITDLVISSWDERLNSRNAMVPAAFVIQGESVEKQTDAIPKDSLLKPLFQTFFIDDNGNMKSVDAFGNLEEMRIRPVPEPFVYQDNVGKSKRIDDGFNEIITKEKARAKEVFDKITSYPLSLEPEEESTIKVFIYPDNVGHTDRLDADLNELLEEESIKAQKHK